MVWLNSLCLICKSKMNINLSFPSLFDSTTERARRAKMKALHPTPGTPGYIDIKKLYDYQDSNYVTPKMPPKVHKKALVLDLDETLIHSSPELPKTRVQSIKLADDFYVFVRPDLNKFILKASRLFDLFIFTASEQYYADPIIDQIIPSIDKEHRLYRNSCKFIDGNVCKDLRAFERNLRKVILIDDKVNTFTFFPDNTISVDPWYDDPNDRLLMKTLWPLLKKCEAATDVRGIIGDYNFSQHSGKKRK